MRVQKRDGTYEPVSLNKITNRVRGICLKLSLDRVDPTVIAIETVNGLCDKITTEEIDRYSAKVSAYKIMEDPQYNKLAAGLCISNLHKTTTSDIYEVAKRLYYNTDTLGEHNPSVTKRYLDIVEKNREILNRTIDYEKDYYFDFFGIKTLERAYLYRINTDNKNHIVERPQHMIMRVAIGIHWENIDKVIETYDLISNKYFTHATPTLYNAASPRPQMSSCFLLKMDDSLSDIFELIKKIALISKWAGGIGVHITNIRAIGSLIRGTKGDSDGILPLIRVLNNVARYVNQGGRRKGSIAVYLEPWHYDIFQFCDLRKNTGAEELRARDMFLALWVPDIFMRAVQDDDHWYLMCPDECQNLTTTYGDEFEKIYLQYVKEGKYKKKIRAKDLWFHIIGAQIETGMPYMAFKDNANRQSNYKHKYVLQGSNLCCEIYEPATKDEIAVCNLASICLPRFIEEDENGEKFYNFEKLMKIARVVTRNLDYVIDHNFYPVEETKHSNMLHRPIGLGVQGLADVYCIMKYPFDSPEAFELNKKIFETIYFGCITESNILAKERGSYKTFKGSPFSKGQFQFHLWGFSEEDLLMNYDWKSLKENVKKWGMRNAQLTALMPTASTSQIMGNNEAFEPFTSNLYTRTTLAGEFIRVNEHLVEDLIKLDLWTKEVREELLYDNGSIQNIEEIPQNIKDLYKIAFEMKTKPLVQQSIDRGKFVDGGCSMNLFSDQPDSRMLTSSHFYGWKNGIKTGMYYLRSRTAVNAIKFGLDPDSIKRIERKRGIVDDSSEDESKSDNKIQRINEIELNLGIKNRQNNYMECDMCSG